MIENVIEKYNFFIVYLFSDKTNIFLIQNHCILKKIFSPVGQEPGSGGKPLHAGLVR